MEGSDHPPPKNRLPVCGVHPIAQSAPPTHRLHSAAGDPLNFGATVRGPGMCASLASPESADRVQAGAFRGYALKWNPPFTTDIVQYH